MTDPSASRADVTRLNILRAAAHQFALKSYSAVNLDDIVAAAGLTKGAMYFHFRSKYALARAIIDHQTSMKRTAVTELLARRFSGLETLVDISFLNANQDIGEDLARAQLHLLESIGRPDGLHLQLLREQMNQFTVVVRRAVDEGDIRTDCDPEHVSRLLVAQYIGIRESSDLDEPEQFLGNIGSSWALLLPGLVNPDRIEYFTQLIRRRTALAIKNASVRVISDDL